MTRREHVTEMILEPIAGLRQEDYEMEVLVPEQTNDADLLRIVSVVEETQGNFSPIARPRSAS